MAVHTPLDPAFDAAWLAADGTTVESIQGNIIVGATVRTRSFTLPAGNYRFDVSAINGVGEGPAVRSEMIAAR